MGWRRFLHLLTCACLLIAACAPLSKTTMPVSGTPREGSKKAPAISPNADQTKASGSLQDKIHAIVDEYRNESESNRFRGDLLLAHHEVPLVQIAKYGKYGRRFQIASITKPMTAIAVMQLVEQGRIQLHDSIRTYIPELSAIHEKMTIDQLLGHRSGLGDYTQDDEIMKRRFAPISQAYMIKYIASAPLVASPGQKFFYSNTGYYLLGILIERVSGMPWKDYLSKHIWKPAGMHHTNTNLEDLAPGLSLQQESLVTARLEDESFSYSSGGVVSTAEDLLRFGIALRNETFLSKARIEQMWTPGKVMQGRNKYGYGFVVSRLPNGRRILRHSGGIDGFTSDWAMTDDGQWLSVVLANAETVLSARINHEVMQMALAHEAQDSL